MKQHANIISHETTIFVVSKFSSIHNTNMTAVNYFEEGVKIAAFNTGC
jgi:hypothetical protein